MKVIDIKDSPAYNPKMLIGNDSVSTGKVILYLEDVLFKKFNEFLLNSYPYCREHGAMLKVSKNRPIWRCPECHEGCWYE